MTQKVTFPHFGDYCIPIEHLVTRGLGLDYVIPPVMTKKTLELGSRYSPDYVCAPFKIHLGCFIEAIEQGADTLVQVGGVCRLGYYGELHEQLLGDLGYKVSFINLARGDFSHPHTLYAVFREHLEGLSLKRITPALLTAVDMVKSMDRIDDFVRQNIGFEAEPGSFDALHADYLESLRLVETRNEAAYVTKNYIKRFKAVPVKKPARPLRVGIVGEYYSIMDPFSNHFIERELAKMGIVVHRWMNISNSLLTSTDKQMKQRIRGYSKYNMGATAMWTIDCALGYAKRGFDGIIHVKSFGCTPEMDAIPVLQNISTDYKVPILYFSFDSQTADAGIQTRLEAFYDMIQMRKQRR